MSDKEKLDFSKCYYRARLKSKLLQCIPQLEIKGRIANAQFLDFVYRDKQIHIKAITEIVVTKEMGMSIAVTAETTSELKHKHNIESMPMVSDVLANEMVMVLERRMVKSLNDAGVVTFREKYTLIDKLWKLVSGREKRIKVKNAQWLLTKILSYSNMIMHNNRVSRANMFITNGQIGAIIQDLSQFVVEPPPALNIAGAVYRIGRVPQGNSWIDVYVDPRMKWSDNKVVLAMLKKDGPYPDFIKSKVQAVRGLNFIYSDDPIDVSCVSEGTFAPKILAKEYNLFKWFGNNSKRSCYTIGFKLPKNIL